MMSDCPTCGARISKRLVEQVLNPMREESCPVDIVKRRIKKKAKNTDKKLDLMTLMLLGSVMEEMEPY